LTNHDIADNTDEASTEEYDVRNIRDTVSSSFQTFISQKISKARKRNRNKNGK